MPIDQDKIAGAVQSPFFIGLLGGIVALRGVPGSSWKERGFNVLSATLVAGFLSPAIAEFFGLNTQAMQSACAFAVGLFGLNITAAIVGYINTADLGAILPWGKKKGG